MAHLEIFTSQQQECLLGFGFCLCTTFKSLKLETPLQCRHADSEPLLYSSDSCINMSFQDGSEETTLQPQHLFSHRTFLCHVSIDPYKLPFPFPFLFSNRVSNYRSSNWLQKCTVCVCLCKSDWCFPFRGTEGERTARTKMLIKCSVAGKDTWECMH